MKNLPHHLSNSSCRSPFLSLLAFRNWLTLTLLALLISASPRLQAQVSDNFTDLDDTNNPVWTHLTLEAASTGQTWDASTGQYRLQAPNNGFSGFGFVGSYAGPVSTNVTVKADFVSFGGPGTNGVFGVGARLNGADGFVALTGYAYVYEPYAASLAGEMVLYRLDAGGLGTDIGSQVVSLDTNKDYTFVLEVSDSSVHGQVFEIGGGMVAEKFAVSSNYTSGYSGVFGFGRAGVTTPTDFTIDNFSATPLAIGQSHRLIGLSGQLADSTQTSPPAFDFPDNTWFQISTANGAVTKLFTGTFVPDSHSIGYCPVDGRAYHTGGSEAYRNNPCQSGQPQYLIPVRVHGLAFQDNQYMEAVNIGTQVPTPIYNANPCPNPDTNTFDCDETQNPPEGTGFTLPCWGLPAPAPSWQLPNYRRQATQLSGYQETGSNEVSSIRGMAWSTSSNLFYVTSDGGIFKMTKDGDCTFLARPAFTNDAVVGHVDREKGIAFVNVGGVTKLLIGHRDANYLMEVDPATGDNIGEIAVDYAGGDGILGLAQDPVTGTLYGISHTADTTARDLITINPVTGATTLVGTMPMHIASIAFVPELLITSITESGGTLTITWAGAAGPTYSLQRTTSLNPPIVWTTLANGLTGSSTTTPVTSDQSFYRISKP